LSSDRSRSPTSGTSWRTRSSRSSTRRPIPRRTCSAAHHLADAAPPQAAGGTTPGDIVASFARWHGLLDLAWTPDAALLQQQIIADGDAVEVVLDADGEAAYLRLATRFAREIGLLLLTAAGRGERADPDAHRTRRAGTSSPKPVLPHSACAKPDDPQSSAIDPRLHLHPQELALVDGAI
jgi:hypothetical protein